MDYEYLGKCIEHAVRDGIETGSWLAADPHDKRNIETLRAQFAGQAMHALMTQIGGKDLWDETVADLAVKQADALLRALGYELQKAEESK